MGFRVLKSLLWVHELKLPARIPLFSQPISKFCCLQKTLCKCKIVSKTGLIIFLQTCSSSSSPLSQSQLLLPLRTVAQDRNFQVIVDTFLSLTWRVSGQLLKVTAETLSHSKFLQVSPLSSSKYNSLLGVPCALRFHEKWAFISYLTVMGLMAGLLLNYCWKTN